MDFWATLEGSSVAEALKVSFVAYPLVNALHIIGVGALLTSVVLMDLRLLGAFPAIEPSPFVSLMRRVALTGFAIAVLTGLPLFAIQASDYVRNVAFLAKMGLLLAAGFNALFFHAVTGGFETASGRMRSSISLSIVLWLGVLVAGRFIGFI